MQLLLLLLLFRQVWAMRLADPWLSFFYPFIQVSLLQLWSWLWLLLVLLLLLPQKLPKFDHAVSISQLATVSFCQALSQNVDVLRVVAAEIAAVIRQSIAFYSMWKQKYICMYLCIFPYTFLEVFEQSKRTNKQTNKQVDYSSIMSLGQFREPNLWVVHCGMG